ncbi:uncharacterized protein [Panulirus ornatus]|uniref:uncharacterized protein n=1 Tax=Panulirus ornatus TaxID=150431 RepID=UPI003A83F6F0
MEVRLEIIQKPEVGDKFCSICCQKSVVCGILPDDKIPRLESGDIPDIFIGSNDLLSRKTVGYEAELLLGKMASEKGITVDGEKEFYYQRLKHLAGPKCNVRGFDGATEDITGQPTAGLA